MTTKGSDSPSGTVSNGPLKVTSQAEPQVYPQAQPLATQAHLVAPMQPPLECIIILFSIALEKLKGTVHPIAAPFKGIILFGGELAKLQKANTDHGNALTAFPTSAAPWTSYTI